MKHTILLILLTISTNLFSQSLTKGEVEGLLNSKKFTFKANIVSPINGKSQHLSSGYFVSVSDGIKSNLPFFGVSYSETSESGIKFDSKKFNYSIVEEKKVWKVTVTPTDLGYSSTLNFCISHNGNTYLTVLDSRRQEIHFTGNIEAN